MSMMKREPIPPIFQRILDNAQAPRSLETDEAWHLFVLGQLSVAGLIGALNKAKWN
jgi:hypothetical protein